MGGRWLIYFKWTGGLLNRIVYKRHIGQLKIKWPIKPKRIKRQIHENLYDERKHVSSLIFQNHVIHLESEINNRNQLKFTIYYS